MSHLRSAVALRVLDPRENLHGDGESLDNIITNTLPDGAVCWVSNEDASYRFVQDSTMIADGFEIVAPIAGPGRWFREPGTLTQGSSGALEFGSIDNPVTFVFTQPGSGDPTFFVFPEMALSPLSTDFSNPEPGVLRYTGPRTKRFLLSYSVALILQAITGGTEASLILMGVSKSAVPEFILTALSYEELSIAAGTGDNNAFAHSAQVMIMMNPGDEIRLVIASFVAETLTFQVNAVNLSAWEI